MQTVYNRTFEVVPMLMVAVIWYLFITSLLNLGQSAIERYYSRGTRRTLPNVKRRQNTTEDKAVPIINSPGLARKEDL